MLFATIDKVLQGVPPPMQMAWSHVLDAGKAAGTSNKAAATIALFNATRVA
jgi:hypothetical protein